MRNPHLHFGLYNTSVVTVPREMFRNAQRVRNITVEIRNSDTRTLHNPSSSYKPGVPGERFLMRLRLAGSHLNCDCDIGYDIIKSNCYSRIFDNIDLKETKYVVVNYNAHCFNSTNY